MKNKKTKYKALQANLLGQKIGEELVKKAKEKIMNNERKITTCTSCKHWTTAEPYYDEREISEDNPDGIVEEPICGNIKANWYNDYRPCDCQACELYERE